MVGEELGIGNQGIRQHHGECFDEFEKKQLQAFVIIAVRKIIEKQLEQAIHLVLNDRRRQFDDDDYGFDEEAFVLVVLEVGAEVVEAVISVLFEIGSNQHRWIFVEEDADDAQGPQSDAFIAVLDGLEEVAQ